ncbi:hypothetical protein ACQPZJ_12610 [Actinoplanes sp. CA-054009]
MLARAASLTCFTRGPTGMCLDGSLSQGARLVAGNGGSYQHWYAYI